MSCARGNSPRSSYSVASASRTETSGSLSDSRAARLRARSSASSASAADQPPVATSAWPSEDSSSTSERVRSGPAVELGRGVERGAQVADALRVRVAAERALRREAQEAHRALGIAAGDEVEAQLGRHARRRGPVALGEMRADAGVQPRAGVGRQQLVEHLAVQVVRERVARRRAARSAACAGRARRSAPRPPRGRGPARRRACRRRSRARPRSRRPAPRRPRTGAGRAGRGCARAASAARRPRASRAGA